MSIANGMQIDDFAAGDRDTMLSASRANEIVDALNALLTMQVKRGDSDAVLISEGGTIIQIKDPQLEVLVALKPYKVQTHGFNVINCKTWDGHAEGPTVIPIAKPYDLWFSINSETIGGDTVVYSAQDVGAQSRIATVGDVNETQVIRRPYIAGDIIWAFKGIAGVVDDSGKDIGLLDVNRDARKWLAVPPA